MNTSTIPGSIIGYRKDGRPIRLIAGGDPSTDPPAGDPPAGDPPAGRTFTQEEFDKAMARERDKLYGRLSKSDEAQAKMAAELEKLQKDRDDRAAAEEKARKDAEKAAKAAAEAEMSAKDLIDRRTAELQAQYQAQQDQWAAQVQGLQQQMEQREAIFAKEREFQELATYAQNQVTANQDNIAPQFIKYITGTTKEEIDAAIAQALADTNEILAGIQNAQVAQRAAMPGVSTGGFTPTGPIDGQSGTKTYTVEEIKAMSGEEFAKHRAAFGVTGNNVGTGKLGHLGRGIFG